MTAKLPKSIRVGCFDYAVEDWDVKQASAKNRFGECDRQNNIIKVRTDMPPQRVAETLWHEVLHAAYDVGACHTGDEETVVLIMGALQCQIMRDNPELMAFMNEMVK